MKKLIIGALSVAILSTGAIGQTTPQKPANQQPAQSDTVPSNRTHNDSTKMKKKTGSGGGMSTKKDNTQNKK